MKSTAVHAADHKTCEHRGRSFVETGTKYRTFTIKKQENSRRSCLHIPYHAHVGLGSETMKITAVHTAVHGNCELDKPW
jgi:hypothetical protein